ncbi:MAG: DUF1576 domain-containing protein [Chloroflexota bacterium]|nr:DUF1576 domain-containing protein [Chloroflexota bacterium]
MNQHRNRSGIVHHANRSLTQRGWFILLGLYMLALTGLGLACEPGKTILPGLLRIFQSQSVLLSDYIEIGGIGAALVNAGLVGVAGLLLAYLNGVLLSGPIIAAVFTMAGFGLFGKNLLNIWPIILGVAIFSRVIRRPFKSYILVAMFGTALAPLVSQVAYGLELGLLPGLLFGLATGFLLPPLAVYMLRLHQGFNIYNVGLTCGFLGLFIASLLEGVGLQAPPSLYWSTQYSSTLRVFLLIYSISMLATGLYLDRGFTSLRRLTREAGTLPTDFVELHGSGATLINMGLVGLIGWGYILLVGGVFNGPTVGGVLTMVGFAAFGKHILNTPPIMLGVYLGSRLTIWQPDQAGPLLAALFATTLAPISGTFGPLLGILAGGVHLMLVMRTAAWHGALNLYNNGFAGGLTATLMVGIISWWTNWRDNRHTEGGNEHHD